MLIELLEAYYQSEANEAAAKPSNPFRASRAGHCTRAMAYDKLGIAGDVLTPRRSAVFKHGHIIDAALKLDLAVVLRDRFLNLDDLPANTCEIEGVQIGFTPDGAFQTETGDIGIVEIKTMSDWAFDRALKGEIDRSYLCQAWTYHYGTSFNPVVFLCYRKETSHFCEVVFDRNAKETVVTQRFGGDPRELYTQDPLLIAEIRTPFDASVEAEVREKFLSLACVETEADLAWVKGVSAIEAEVVKVQGKAKAAEAEPVYGAPIATAGSWYTFATGRKIAGFPCSYCRHIRTCLGARLEIKDNKPLWIMDALAGGRANSAAVNDPAEKPTVARAWTFAEMSRALDGAQSTAELDVMKRELTPSIALLPEIDRDQIDWLTGQRRAQLAAAVIEANARKPLGKKKAKA